MESGPVEQSGVHAPIVGSSLGPYLYNCAILHPRVRTVSPELALAVTDALGRRQATSPALDSAGPGYVSEEAHRGHLRDLEARSGLAAVFDAGHWIATTSTDPVMRFLAASPGPHDLVERFRRLERRFHLGHRTVFDMGRSQMRVAHLAVWGPEPQAAESVFVCGASAGMLERIGARHIQVVISAPNRAPVYVRPGREPTTIGALDSPVRWRTTWQPQQPEEVVMAGLPAQLRNLVAADPAACWTVESAARRLGLSPRTLQRRHQNAGTQFSSTVSDGRLDAAESLLLRTGLPATEIAAACGFFDLPHLTRHLVRRHETTPGRFRLSGDGPKQRC